MSAQVIEAMVLRWSESPSGRTVTFLLPEEGEAHPFRGIKCGPSFGQRVALSVALISDDETQTPVSPAEQADRTKPAKDRKRWSELPLSQQAAIRCGEPAFRRFLAEGDPQSGIAVLDLDMAAEEVRNLCRVHSRKDIKDGTAAGTTWRQIDSKFQTWLAAA